MWPFSKSKTPVYAEDLCSCHICGCLLVRNKNTEGKPEIIPVKYLLSLWTNDKGIRYELHERYYCKLHRPKED